MRLTDMHCEGECYTHGVWEIRVQFTHRGKEIVPDECPMCIVDAAPGKLEAEFEHGLEQGAQ